MEAITQIVTKHLQEVQKGIIANMQAMGRMASGRSVASLQIEETENSDGIASAALTGGQQWEIMQRGRNAGKVPYRFSDIIKEWILKKGISYREFAPKNGPAERGLTNLSWMITRSIMQKGTRLHRDNGYNDIYDTLIAEELEKLADESAGIIDVEVDKINKQYEND